MLKKPKPVSRIQCVELMAAGRSGEYGHVVLQLAAKASRYVLDTATIRHQCTAGGTVKGSQRRR